MMMRAGLHLKSVWVAYMLLAVSAGLERVPVPASHGVLFRRVHDRPVPRSGRGGAAAGAGRRRRSMQGLCDYAGEERRDG